MPTLFIPGWKTKVSVNPMTLLQALRDSLSLDLRTAKVALDRFSEKGELRIRVSGADVEKVLATAARAAIEIVLVPTIDEADEVVDLRSNGFS